MQIFVDPAAFPGTHLRGWESSAERVLQLGTVNWALTKSAHRPEGLAPTKRVGPNCLLYI
jgi:hypothetical protein